LTVSFRHTFDVIGDCVSMVNYDVVLDGKKFILGILGIIMAVRLRLLLELILRPHCPETSECSLRRLSRDPACLLQGLAWRRPRLNSVHVQAAALMRVRPRSVYSPGIFYVPGSLEHRVRTSRSQVLLDLPSRQALHYSVDFRIVVEQACLRVLIFRRQARDVAILLLRLQARRRSDACVCDAGHSSP